MLMESKDKNSGGQLQQVRQVIWVRPGDADDCG